MKSRGVKGKPRKNNKREITIKVKRICSKRTEMDTE